MSLKSNDLDAYFKHLAAKHESIKSEHERFLRDLEFEYRRKRGEDVAVYNGKVVPADRVADLMNLDAKLDSGL